MTSKTEFQLMVGTVRASSDDIVNPDWIDLNDCRTGRYGQQLFAVGNEFGLLAIVQERCLQDAIDASVDEGKFDCMALNDDEHAEFLENDYDVTYLGNAGEPFCIDYLWSAVIPPCDFEKVRKLLSQRSR